ncbi:hypothetical protein PVL29_010783 [Vitis rotundifolia]|uniref:Uncharacterized protein n=1 Tax=Vitis rotundifolia TaxID=103349 RepID=A0AA38ZUI2_VITRO|nr:hypothetical protein PVL29_010783 [Vitis rotundifolia]
MGGRRQKGDYHHQEFQKTRSLNRKPPLGNWQPTVPSWEKKFCSSVGSFPWQRLLENKRFIYLYDNVLQWNDSAGKEAFHNAKNRFWAQINGLPCDISLPDPDIYIDEIDWNCSIDPEMILDLEQEPVDPDDCVKNEKVSSLGNSLLLLNQSFSCTGWGDAEEDIGKAADIRSGPGLWHHNQNVDNPWELSCTQNKGAVKATGWGDCEEPVKAMGWGDCEEPVEATGWGNSNEPVKATGWGNSNEPVKATGWGDWDQPVEATGWGDYYGAMEGPIWKDGWNNSSGWNQYENKYNDLENLKDRRAGGVWGTGNGNSRGEGGGYMSRYRSSRFNDNEYQADRGWRSGGGKRANFLYDEGPFLDKKAASQPRNTIHHCGPVSHHGSGKAGNSWSWKKPVS